MYFSFLTFVFLREMSILERLYCFLTFPYALFIELHLLVVTIQDLGPSNQQLVVFLLAVFGTRYFQYRLENGTNLYDHVTNFTQFLIHNSAAARRRRHSEPINETHKLNGRRQLVGSSQADTLIFGICSSK